MFDSLFVRLLSLAPGRSLNSFRAALFFPKIFHKTRISQTRSENILSTFPTSSVIADIGDSRRRSRTNVVVVVVALPLNPYRLIYRNGFRASLPPASAILSRKAIYFDFFFFLITYAFPAAGRAGESVIPRKTRVLTARIYRLWRAHIISPGFRLSRQYIITSAGDVQSVFRRIVLRRFRNGA